MNHGVSLYYDKMVQDFAGKTHYAEFFGIMHGIKLYSCFADKTHKTLRGYVGMVCEGVYSFLSDTPDDAIESVLDCRDKMKNSARQKITTSVGNVYNGVKLGGDGYCTVFLCYDIKTGLQRGYVCNINNQCFGPLCPSRSLAEHLARNVLDARTR